MSGSLKEFEKWWKKYTSEGICDYEECYEMGWQAALKWIYYAGVLSHTLAGDLIKEELEDGTI